MPSADQDVVQQKPSFTGAGIGSRAATRNESAVSYEATQSSPSTLFINLVLVQLICKLIFAQPPEKLADRRAPLECGLCLVICFQRINHGSGHVYKFTVEKFGKHTTLAR